MSILMVQRIPINLWPTSIWQGLSQVILLVSLIACSLSPTKANEPDPTEPGSDASQVGVASWYGPGFHGKRTASGAIYNQHELTAAHQTLPIGSRVIVTNLQNGRSVEVAINDRGPFVKRRIIDLSYAAARVLGMVGPGTIPVRIDLIESGPTEIRTIRANLDYTLQVGSFIEIENAQELKDQLAKSNSWDSRISIVPFRSRDSIYHRVQLGTFSNRSEAEMHADDLARQGFSVIIMEK